MSVLAYILTYQKDLKKGKPNKLFSPPKFMGSTNSAVTRRSDTYKIYSINPETQNEERNVDIAVIAKEMSDKNYYYNWRKYACCF